MIFFLFFFLFCFSYMLYPILPIQLHLNLPSCPVNIVLVNGFRKVLCLPVVLSFVYLMYFFMPNNY